MTAERRAQAIADTTSALDWFTIPHTLERVIGIYAEATRESPSGHLPHGLSNEDILARLYGNRGSDDEGDGPEDSAGSRHARGTHSDPTGDAAVWGEPGAVDDADETLRSIDCALELIVETCVEVNAMCLDVLDVEPWTPTWPHGRDSRVVVARKLVHRFAPMVESAVAAGADEGHLTFLLATSLAETAEWLQRKCEAIWQASRGDRRPVAVQRKISECRNCAEWRTGTMAGPSGLCSQCKGCQSQHKVLPTKEIVAWWESGRRGIQSELVKAAQKAMRANARPRAKASG